MSLLHASVSTALRHLDPETAHTLALKGLAMGLGPKSAITAPARLFGKDIQSPVMIAAGADKNFATARGWQSLGAGGVEYGSIRSRPHTGNPRPRIWRTEREGVVNWMGLNSIGIQAFTQRMDDVLAREGEPRGMLIGASLVAPEGSVEDKSAQLKGMAFMLGHRADYLTFNVSCPNTKEGAQGVDDIARQVGAIRRSLELVQKPDLPLMVKFGPMWLDAVPERDGAPDQALADLLATARACRDAGATGFIACNTATVGQRTRLGGWGPHDWPTNARGEDVGGYSGLGLAAMRRRMVSALRRHFGSEVPLIAVGGIRHAEDARWQLDNGADALQVYSGLVYNPNLVERLNAGLGQRGGRADEGNR